MCTICIEISYEDIYNYIEIDKINMLSKSVF